MGRRFGTRCGLGILAAGETAASQLHDEIDASMFHATDVA